MLRANVDKKNKTSGSGRKADIVGYDVLGKTGTAQKPSKKEKGYSKEILNVFASAFPSKKPKYVFFQECHLLKIKNPTSKIIQDLDAEKILTLLIFGPENQNLVISISTISMY